MASTADELANAVPAIDRDCVDREPGLHDLRRGTHAGAIGSGVRRPGDRRATRPGSDLVTLAVCPKIVAAIAAFSSNVAVRRKLYCKRARRARPLVDRRCVRARLGGREREQRDA